MKKMKRFVGKCCLIICILTNIVVMHSSDINLNVQAAQVKTVNHATGSTVTANRSPISYWGPEKIVDGVVNRDAAKSEQSRWSSESGAPGWVQFDLSENKSFNELYIAWETQTVKDYHLEKSDDGITFTTFYTAPTNTDGHPIDDYITLNTPEEARYVKLVIDSLKSGAYPSLSLYEVEIKETKELDNLSLDATITSKDHEAASVVAENAKDGNVDTWWGSGYRTTQTWLALDYGEKKDINSILIHWERKNATNYEIQTSEDGDSWTTILSYSEKPSSFQQIINFDSTIKTQYLRILINAYDATAETENGSSVTWATVGVKEFETYGEFLDIPEVPRLTPKEVADNLTLTPVAASDTTFAMPEVPEGYTISFVGADYEQILTHDLKIVRPLIDRTVVVNFEVTDDESGVVATSKEYQVLISGLYDQITSVNEKPTVIPELQEWYGLSGEFAVHDGSRIVVGDDMFMEAAKEMQKDYEDITGNPIEVVSGTPSAGDFYFVAKSSLEEETYEMNVEDYLTVSASTNLGAYWSTRSILQILKQTGTTIPKGYVKDYPKYEVRGFMLDVARKPFTMDFLYEITEQMSWYKLNDFQVHLNDNHIQSPETYIGYRLESDIPNLANTDLYYTKEEFTQFINDSKNIGVAIVPEFDTPGHAAAFTRANPEIARGDEIEYLDVENPEALEFVKKVISEYIDGENPVFPAGTIVHVGTDEYKRGNKEAFRQYQNDLLEWIRDDKGITPRVWGSQTENAGTTPITVEGVQMNLWNNGYSNPKTMYELGYDLINTRDGDLYIVPGAGYYSDYINQGKIATTWQPNNIGGTIIPVGDEQMLGATFAVWNDMNSNPPSQHTLRDNGFTEVEIYDRIFAITPTFGAKLWGDINDYSVTEINEIVATTKYAPNSNPTHEVESKTDVIVDYSFDKEDGKDYSGNAYDLLEQKNVDYVKGNDNNALQLNGGESYIETPLDDMGINKTIDFWIKKDVTSSDEEQILFESEVGAIKAVQKDTGKFGYSTDFRNHSFNYTLPEDEWVHITLKTYFSRTELYVNGKKVDELSKSGTGGLAASLITPFERIGSETNSFKGQLDDLVVYNEIKSDDINIIPHENMTASVDSAQSGAGGELAIDDDPSTIWHTKWDLSDPLPQSITLTLDNEYTIDKLTYLPRPTGTNGNITKYIVSVSNDGENYEEVTSGTWANSGDLKTVEFAAVKANYVRLTAVEGVGGFATAAEINVYHVQNELDTEKLSNLIATAEDLDLSLYVPFGAIKLDFEIREAKRVLSTAMTQEEIDEATVNLQAVIDALEEIINTSELEALILEAEKIDTNKYTQASVETLTQALTGANEVLANAITQEEVDKAVADLQVAIDALDSLEEHAVVDTSKLKVLISEAEEIDTSGYTQTSVETLTQALVAAKEVLANATTQEEVDKAITRLQVAIDALEKEKEVISKPSIPVTEDKSDSDATIKESTSPEKAANTGDTTNITILLFLALTSLSSGYYVLRQRKRNQNQEKE